VAVIPDLAQTGNFTFAARVAARLSGDLAPSLP
jgi:hypothetical protein